VLKDRTDLMNGQIIDNPGFKDFLLVINSLNLGGEHFVLDTARTSDAMIHNPDYSYEDRRRAQKIASEEIEGELTSAYPGTSKEEKKIKADILEVVFESRSWTKICDLPPAKLQTGLVHVKYLLRCIKDNGELPEPDQFMSWLRGRVDRAA